jgi:hypothetical protein
MTPTAPSAANAPTLGSSTVGRMRADATNTHALGPKVVVSQVPAAVADSSVDNASACVFTHRGGGQGECRSRRGGSIMWSREGPLGPRVGQQL